MYVGNVYLKDFARINIECRQIQHRLEKAINCGHPFLKADLVIVTFDACIHMLLFVEFQSCEILSTSNCELRKKPQQPSAKQNLTSPFEILDKNRNIREKYLPNSVEARATAVISELV